MLKIILSAFLVFIGTAAATAQTDDYVRTEFYAGYSNNQIETQPDSRSFQSFVNNRRSYNGSEGAAVYNLSRYFGIKGDFSAAYKNRRESVDVLTGTAAGTTITFDSKQSSYNFMGGVQVKDNAQKTRIKPFAHALIGIGTQRFSADNLACTGSCPPFSTNRSRTGFSAAIGGGLDIKLNDKIDIRAIQIDYNPLILDGNASHNVRLGIGIVFKK